MSEILNMWKKASESREEYLKKIEIELTHAKTDDIKKKILAKIEEESFKSTVKGNILKISALSKRIGPDEKGALKIFNKPAEETARSGEGPGDDLIFKTAEDVVRMVSEKAAGEDYTDKPSPEARVDQGPEDPTKEDGVPAHPAVKKAIADYQDKLASAEAANKKLKQLADELFNKNSNLAIQIEEKNKKISGLGGRASPEPDNLKADKEKAAANMDTLRSKLYAAGKEIKEQSGRINQLEEMLRAKDRKIADNEKICIESEAEKKDLAEKLLLAEAAKKEIENKVSELQSEIDSRDRKILENERLHEKNAEILKNETQIKLQAYERIRKNLDGKISQLSLEIEAKNKRLEESESSYAELEETVRDMTFKFQESEATKKGLDEELLRLKTDVEEKSRKREELDRLYRALDSDMKENSVKVQTAERTKKDLEGKISQLSLEIEAKNKRLEESESSYAELEETVRDAMTKLQESDAVRKELAQRVAQFDQELACMAKKHEDQTLLAKEDAKKLESDMDMLKGIIKGKDKAQGEFNEKINHMQSDIEDRDRKIEADIKYCEKLVQEINSLRQKAKKGVSKR